LGQSNGGGAGVVELGVNAGARLRAGILEGLCVYRHAGAHEAPQSSTIQIGWATLALVLAGDGAAAAGSGCPADVAQVVALAVLAQALEVAAQSALPGLAQWISI